MQSTFWSSGSGWGARDFTFLASYQNMLMCFSHTLNSKDLSCTSSSWPLQAEICQGRMSSKIWLDMWGDWMEFILRSLGLSASHYSEGKPAQMLTHAIYKTTDDAEEGNARQVKEVKKMRWNIKRWLTDMYVAGCYQSTVQTAREAAAESSPRGRKS